MDTNTIKETVIAIPKEPEPAVDITALPEIAFFMQKLALNIWIFHVKAKEEFAHEELDKLKYRLQDCADGLIEAAEGYVPGISDSADFSINEDFNVPYSLEGVINIVNTAIGLCEKLSKSEITGINVYVDELAKNAVKALYKLQKFSLIHR